MRAFGFHQSFAQQQPQTQVFAGPLEFAHIADLAQRQFAPGPIAPRRAGNAFVTSATAGKQIKLPKGSTTFLHVGSLSDSLAKENLDTMRGKNTCALWTKKAARGRRPFCFWRSAPLNGHEGRPDNRPLGTLRVVPGAPSFIPSGAATASVPAAASAASVPDVRHAPASATVSPPAFPRPARSRQWFASRYPGSRSP